MSGVINKVKDALSSKDHSTTTTHSTTHTTGPTGTTGLHGTTGGVAQPHSSGIANTSHTTGGYTGAGTGVTGTGHSTSTNAGPHNSNMANKLDPRVDSDLDGSRNAGAASGATTAGYTGQHTTGAGYTGQPTTGAGYTGQHTTNTHGAGTGTHFGNTPGNHTGTTGGISHSTNAGPHNSNLANKADPRVDSDLDGRGNRHGANTGGVFGASGSHATAGSGTAQNTAGPHNSDMANKLDPRVDSDRDGSKTFGGNATHQ